MGFNHHGIMGAASVSVPRWTMPSGYSYIPEPLVIAAWPIRRGAAAAQAHLPGGVSCGSVPGLGISLDYLLVGQPEPIAVF